MVPKNSPKKSGKSKRATKGTARGSAKGKARSRPSPNAKTGVRTKAGTKARTGRRKVAWYVTALRLLAIGLAVGAMGVVTYWAAKLTFTPIDDNGQAVGNTDVGHSLRFYLDRPSVKEAVRQIGGNLVLLAPFGILLPIVFVRLRRVWQMAAAAVLISLTVETVQGVLIPGRAFDVDDVILNAAGVILAHLLVGRRIAVLVRGRAGQGGR